MKEQGLLMCCTQYSLTITILKIRTKESISSSLYIINILSFYFWNIHLIRGKHQKLVFYMRGNIKNVSQRHGRRTERVPLMDGAFLFGWEKILVATSLPIWCWGGIVSILTFRQWMVEEFPGYSANLQHETSPWWFHWLILGELCLAGRFWFQKDIIKPWHFHLHTLKFAKRFLWL